MELSNYTHTRLVKRDVLILVVLIGITLWSSMKVYAQGAARDYLTVSFLNIGQGDAMFIEAPNGNQVLIDGGPDNTILSQLGSVMSPDDHSIDMLILTHAHADHVNGLVDVLGRYQVDYILERHIAYGKQGSGYAQWDALKTSHASVVQAHQDQVIDLGAGVSLHVLYPDSDIPYDAHFKNAHDAMVVLRLVYGDQSILFTGDMERPVEDRLIAEHMMLKSTILKVGHHGSKTSTSEELLNVVQPDVGFIEVGAHNRYGLPAPVTLQRLDKHGIRYYRTDTDGAMQVLLDGHTYTIKRINTL